MKHEAYLTSPYKYMKIEERAFVPPVVVYTELAAFWQTGVGPVGVPGCPGNELIVTYKVSE